MSLCCITGSERMYVLHAVCYTLRSVKLFLRLNFVPYFQLLLCALCACGVLQVFLCSVGHPHSSRGTQWIGPSSSITVILWALSRGKINKIQLQENGI